MFIYSAKSASEVSESQEYSLEAALLVSDVGHMGCVLVVISMLPIFVCDVYLPEELN